MLSLWLKKHQTFCMMGKCFWLCLYFTWISPSRSFFDPSSHFWQLRHSYPSWLFICMSLFRVNIAISFFFCFVVTFLTVNALFSFMVVHFHGSISREYRHLVHFLFHLYISDNKGILSLHERKPLLSEMWRWNKKQTRCQYSREIETWR